MTQVAHTAVRSAAALREAASGLKRRSEWEPLAALAAELPPHLGAEYLPVADEVAFAYTQLGRDQAARDLLLRAYDIEPTHRRASALAYVHYSALLRHKVRKPRLDEPEPWRKGFERWIAEALRHKPESLVDRYRLGVYHAGIQAWKDALALKAFGDVLRLFERLPAAQRTPQSRHWKTYIRALYGAARSAYRLGRFDEARRWIFGCIRADREHHHVEPVFKLFLAAKVLVAQGQLADAERALRLAAEAPHDGDRGDVYARQWYDARRDQSGYWPVRQPLTARVLELHLLGRVTLGQYVLHPDNTVSFAALDFDPTAAAVEQMRLTNEADGALGLAPLVEYVQRIIVVAERAGLAVIAEDTGGVGLHLWCCFAPRIPAERARALLRELLWRAGPQPPAVAVEVFPKQDRLAGKGFGNLIKLPLGLHQVTMRPSRFLDASLQPILAAEALARVRPCDPVAVDALLASRVVSLPIAGREPAASAALPAPAPPTGPTPRALAEALANIAPPARRFSSGGPYCGWLWRGSRTGAPRP